MSPKDFGRIATLAAATAGVMLLLGQTQAAQIYPPHTQWHLTRALSINTMPQTVFTVPAGVDLTITDIVYDFAVDLSTGSEPGGAGMTVHATVSDGGPNPNVTTNNPNPPVFNTNSTVSDSASYQIFYDRFSPPPPPEIGLAGDPVHWFVINELDETPGLHTLEVKSFAPATMSHHFQTGLFIPSDNTVVLDVQGISIGGIGSVTFHLNGRLN